MHWEIKIEALESEIRKAERARRQVQFKIDNFYRSVTVKLAVLSDPYNHIAPQTEEYFKTKRDQLNLDFKSRADNQAELKRRLDDLKRRQILGEPQEALIEAYRSASSLQSSIEADLERQIKSLNDELKKCQTQIEERRKAVNDQVEEL